MNMYAVSLVFFTAAASALAADPSAAPAPVGPAAPIAQAVANPGQAPAQAATTEAPKPGAAVRISGDAKLQPERTKEGGYTLPGTRLRITAPLPDGYPAPTVPGAIELKTYPSVRRAEYTVAGEPMTAMFQSFRPLYNHITGRKIPMTSPVEMDFPAPVKAEKAEKKEGAEQAPVWKVSFLYRTKDLGPTGTDGKVTIVDTAETTVIAIGIDNGIVAGPDAVVDEEAALRKWLASQPQWEQAGELRSFGYTGPGELPWSELQLPVRRKDAAGKAPAAPAAEAKTDGKSTSAQPAEKK